MKAKGTQKEINERLKAVNFEKEDSIYTAPYNLYSRYIKQYSLDTHNTLMCRRLYNNFHK